MLRRALDGALVLFGRRVAGEDVREPLQQRQLVFDQLVLLGS